MIKAAAIRRARLVVARRGATVAVLRGKLEFDHGIRMNVRERPSSFLTASRLFRDARPQKCPMWSMRHVTPRGPPDVTGLFVVRPPFLPNPRYPPVRQRSSGLLRSLAVRLGSVCV
jgi:hypothetical protein